MLRAKLDALVVCAAAVILVCTAGTGAAGELGHYAPGVAPIRDFIVPSPGFYYEQYHVLYAADAYKNRDGDSVDSINIGPATLNVEADVSFFAIVPTLIWVSPWKFLGASYGASASVTLANSSVQAALSTETRFGRSIDESQFGFGDLYLRPLWLGWNGKHYALSAGYGLHAPTGRYDDGAVDNIGLGF